MAEYYKPKGCPVHGITHLNDKDVKIPKLGIDDDEYKRIAKSIKKSTLIQPDLFVYTNNMLNKGLDSVFGDVKYDAPEYVKVQAMKRNIARFAGFKSAWQTANLKNAKPEQYAAINNTYNNLYMKAEYVHTVRSGRAAKNWQRYEADKDLYPFLEYMPSVSAEPRDEHKKLYGVIKPVDDSFWDTWMPPADWGCKCGVEQRRSDNNSQQPPTDIKLPPAAMRNNPGKSGEIITDKHPMIAKLSKADKEKINQWVNIEYNRKLYNSFGKDYTKGGFDEKTGGFWVVHRKHNKKTKHYPDEKIVAKILSNKGYRVELGDESNRGIGIKIPDGFINELTFDVKSIEKNSSGSIRDSIKNAIKKDAKIVVFYYKTEFSSKILHTGIARWKNQERKGRDIEIWYVYKDKLHKIIK